MDTHPAAIEGAASAQAADEPTCFKGGWTRIKKGRGKRSSTWLINKTPCLTSLYYPREHKRLQPQSVSDIPSLTGPRLIHSVQFLPSPPMKTHKPGPSNGRPLPSPQHDLPPRPPHALISSAARPPRHTTAKSVPHTLTHSTSRTPRYLLLWAHSMISSLVS